MSSWHARFPPEARKLRIEPDPSQVQVVGIAVAQDAGSDVGPFWAHITADAEASGELVVSNGLSLCKLHHAAFDRHFLTVRPDYTIEVRQSILDEEDGPMLLHGLKGMHDRPISLPREVSLKPDRERVEERYAAFLASTG